MNESLSSLDQSTLSSAAEESVPGTGKGPWHHRLVRCNPFYLFSALMLVYGIYRISIDPHFLGNETQQVVFNFSALEIYEAMLAATAILLVRRKILYDSALLFWLDNLLVLIPFMLVSHAAFLAPSLGWIICSGAALFAAARFSAFRRWFEGLAVGPGWFGMGGLVLIVNVALPMLFRRGIETDNELWPIRSQYCWDIVLPMLVGLAILLPRPRRKEVGSTSHDILTPWLPLGTVVLWITGTAAHLYTLGYVDQQKFGLSQLAALIWAGSWLLYFRITDFHPQFAAREKLLVLPLFATFLALGSERQEMFLLLNLLNAVVFGAFFWRRNLRLAAVLGALSLLAAVAAIPPEQIDPMIKGYNRAEFVIALLALGGLGASLRFRDAKAGVLGAISIAILALGIFWNSEFAGHIAFQIGCVYFLLHSVRWSAQQEPGVRVLLCLAALGWVLDAILVSESPELRAPAIPLWIGGTAGAALLMGRLLFRRHSWFALGATLCVVFTHPIVQLVSWAERTPTGLLALAASFGLFAAGTVLALRRSKNRTMQPGS